MVRLLPSYYPTGKKFGHRGFGFGYIPPGQFQEAVYMLTYERMYGPYFAPSFN